MKEATALVRFLDRLFISSTRQMELYSGSASYLFSASYLTRLFAKILKIKEGEVIVIGTNNQQAERRLLERLKMDGELDSYYEGPLFCDYPKVYALGITYSAFEFGTKMSYKVWGYVRTNEDRTNAYNKAIGELIERKVTHMDGTSMHHPKFMDASHLYPLLPHFTERQLKANPRLAGTAADLKHVRALKVNDMVNRRTTLLPFSFFYWGGVRSQDEKVFFHETTSGSGGGITYEKAALSSIYELIERDHFLLYWFSGTHPLVVDTETIPNEFGRFIRKLKEEYKLEVYFLDIRHDLDVKATACVLIDPVLGIITSGAKASSSAIETLRSSLMEALVVMMNLREKNNPLNEADLKELLREPSFNKKINTADRLRMYCSQYGIDLVRRHFLQGASESYAQFEVGVKVFPSDKDELGFLVDEFRRLSLSKGEGYVLYSKKIETGLTRKYGYHVVSSFVPSLLKLHLSEEVAAPASDRLYAFAKEKGSPSLTEKDISALPHFFP